MDARCHLIRQLRHTQQPQPVYPTVGGATQSHTPDGQLLSDAVWTYQYDGEGMLIAANKTGVAASFKYDPFSRLIERTVNTSKTRYVYAGSRLLEEYDSATNTLLKRYVYAGADEAVIEMDALGNVTYLHQDHQNSLIARANGAGTLTAKYEYSPWGEASLPGTGFGYTGQRWDADLGLYNYKARYYDPAKGRFLQPDPVGYQQDMNLYTYCVNDPVNMVDPDGMENYKPPHASEIVNTLKGMLRKHYKTNLEQGAAWKAGMPLQTATITETNTMHLPNNKKLNYTDVLMTHIHAPSGDAGFRNYGGKDDFNSMQNDNYDRMWAINGGGEVFVYDREQNSLYRRRLKWFHPLNKEDSYEWQKQPDLSIVDWGNRMGGWGDLFIKHEQNEN